jgi:hypothetical protein
MSLRGLLAAVASVLSVACSSSGGTTPTCSAGATRCVSNAYEACTDGQFVTQAECSAFCDVTLGGCIDCQPDAGATCNANAVETCSSAGKLVLVETCSGTCADAGCQPCTAPGVTLLYLLDDEFRLESFDPENLSFHVIGEPDCQPSPPLDSWHTLTGETVAHPYAFAVDQNAVAWVLYTSGEVFQVSTVNAACAGNSGYTPQQNGMDLFSMAFVGRAAGQGESLFLGGGDVSNPPGGKLASLDPAAPTTAVLIGNLPASGEFAPQLGGDSAYALFAFFPGTTSASVQQIDKNSGDALGNSFTLPGGLGETATDWAFAQWGGGFYIFYTADPAATGATTTLVRIDRATSSVNEAVYTGGQQAFIAASASTCVPLP